MSHRRTAGTGHLIWSSEERFKHFLVDLKAVLMFVYVCLFLYFSKYEFTSKENNIT